MLATGSVVKFVTKKSVLTIEKKMKQCSADRKYPDPAAQRLILRLLGKFRRFGDYCTFWAGVASPPTIDAVFV